MCYYTLIVSLPLPLFLILHRLLSVLLPLLPLLSLLSMLPQLPTLPRGHNHFCTQRSLQLF